MRLDYMNLATVHSSSKTWHEGLWSTFITHSNMWSVIVRRIQIIFCQVWRSMIHDLYLHNSNICNILLSFVSLIVCHRLLDRSEQCRPMGGAYHTTSATYETCAHLTCHAGCSNTTDLAGQVNGGNQHVPPGTLAPNALLQQYLMVSLRQL